MMLINHEKVTAQIVIETILVTKIQIKTKVKIKKINLNQFLLLQKLMKINYRTLFSFLPIFNIFNISVPENAEPIVNYSFGVLILSLLIFYSILNAFLSLYSLHVLNKYNVDKKLENYPRLIKIIKYYENSSMVFICVEIAMALTFTLIIIFSSLFFLGINIFN
jgi:hypothetical protein